MQLTTPISYISSPPIDVFKEGSPAIGGVGLDLRLLGFSGQPRYPYYYTTETTFPGGEPVTGATGDTFKQCQSAGVYWAMYSLGPSKRWNSVGGGGANIYSMLLGEYWENGRGEPSGYPDGYYDPSNGTVSFGRILRSNRGQEPNQ